jgi:hypothetical protein
MFDKLDFIRKELNELKPPALPTIMIDYFDDLDICGR